MPLLEELRLKRDIILDIAAQHGASNVRVFGSVARGEEKKKSDIDLMVQMENGRSYFDLIHLEAALKKILGRSVDISTDEGFSHFMRPYIEKDMSEL